MALTWDQVSGITEKAFVKKLADSIFDFKAKLKCLEIDSLLISLILHEISSNKVSKS